MRLRPSFVAALVVSTVSCARPSDPPQIAGDASTARPTATRGARAVLDAVRAKLPSFRHREPLRRGDDGRITAARAPIDATKWRRESLEVGLADTADGPMRLGSADVAGAWVELRDLDARSVAADLSDARSVLFSGVREGVDVVRLVDGPRDEELRIVTSSDDELVARYDVALGPAIASLRARGDRLEAIDGDGRVLLSTERATAIDAAGRTRDARVTLEAGADARTMRVLVTLDARDLARPIVIDPSWTTVGAMNVRRADATTVRMSDGRVLVVGGTYQTTYGSGDGGPTDSAEIFDPNLGTWSLVTAGSSAPDAAAPQATLGMREYAAGVLLPDGRVLIDGGSDGLVVFTPAPAGTIPSGTFTDFATTGDDGASLASTNARAFARLGSGKIFAVGGDVSGATLLASAYVIDPPTAVAHAVGPIGGATTGDAGAAPVRESMFAVTLGDGVRVLVGGGDAGSTTGGGIDMRREAWIFHSDTAAWESVAPSAYVHGLGFATLLPNGNVLVSGSGFGAGETDVPEIYDPAKNAWHDAPGAPAYISGAAVADQVILLGFDNIPGTDGLVDHAFVAFDVFAQTFSAPGLVPTDSDGTEGRFYPAIATLAGNRVLVAGGGGSTNDGFIYDSTEIYQAPTPTSGDTYCVVSADCFGDAGCDGGFCGGDAPPADAGPDTIDAGSDIGDAGPDTIDAGSDIGDAGPDTIDAGSDIGDAGPDTIDAGSDIGDAGSDIGDAFEPTHVVSGNFTNCSVDSDCASGHCADHVCCDTACASPCHSCALPTSPGVCAIEPTGFDLRNDCSQASSCLSTCGPGGACVDVVEGNTCAPAICVDDSHVQAAAVCAAHGAACPTAGLATLDCSPYICASALRACLTECVASDECVDGYICDVTSKSCVVAGAQNSSGCSCHVVDARDGRPSGAAIATLAIAALLGVGRRNARRAVQRRSC